MIALSSFGSLFTSSLECPMKQIALFFSKHWNHASTLYSDEFLVSDAQFDFGINSQHAKPY